MPDKNCRLCGKTLYGRQLFYCSPEHRRSWHSKQESLISKKEKTRVYNRKTKPRGRQCVFCQAFDDEVLFILSKRCVTCATLYQRNGLCEDCNKIRSSKFGYTRACLHCDQPFGTVKVIIIERSELQNRKRERTIFRFVQNGRVTINGSRRVVQAIPFVLILPTKEWLKVRR